MQTNTVHHYILCECHDIKKIRWNKACSELQWEIQLVGLYQLSQLSHAGNPTGFYGCAERLSQLPIRSPAGGDVFLSKKITRDFIVSPKCLPSVAHSSDIQHLPTSRQGSTKTVVERGAGRSQCSEIISCFGDLCLKHFLLPCYKYVWRYQTWANWRYQTCPGHFNQLRVVRFCRISVGFAQIETSRSAAKGLSNHFNRSFKKFAYTWSSWCGAWWMLEWYGRAFQFQRFTMLNLSTIKKRAPKWWFCVAPGGQSGTLTQHKSCLPSAFSFKYWPILLESCSVVLLSACALSKWKCTARQTNDTWVRQSDVIRLYKTAKICSSRVPLGSRNSKWKCRQLKGLGH